MQIALFEGGNFVLKREWPDDVPIPAGWIDARGLSPKIEIEPPKIPELVPDEISDRQFFEALAYKGIVTQEEALDAVKTGALPASFEAFIQAIPAEQQFSARMILSGATTYRRSHPLTEAFGVMSGLSTEEIDDLWRMAASL